MMEQVREWWSKGIDLVRTVRGQQVALAIVVAVAFARSLFNEFTFDDQMVIRDAALFRSPWSWDAFFTPAYFSLSHESTWRPLVTVSYAVDYFVGGMSPAIYHLQSVAWHAGCAILVFLLARRLAPRQPAGAAMFGALFFALHPVVTEAVDNASFREDPMAAFFTLATVLLGLSPRRSHQRWALATFALALLSKESAIVAPVLLVLCRLGMAEERPADRRKKGGAVARPIPWPPAALLAGLAAVTVVWAAVRFGPLGTPNSYATHPGGSLWSSMLAMPRVFTHYLRLTVWPHPLCPDYSGLFDFSMGFGPARAASILFCVGYVALLVVLWRTQRRVALGLGWFVVALGPVSNLLPLPVPVAERFLYLPLAGMALAVAALAERVWELATAEGTETRRWRPIALGTAAALLLALGATTNARHPDWKNNLSLWGSAARTHPGGHAILHGLGASLLPTDPSTAARVLYRAVRASPQGEERASIQGDLAIALGKVGRLAESEQVLRQAIAVDSSAKMYLNLGITLKQLRRWDEATEAFAEAVRRDVLYARAHAMLAVMRGVEGKMEEAQQLFARARHLNPNEPMVTQELDSLVAQAKQERSQRAEFTPPEPSGGPGAHQGHSHGAHELHGGAHGLPRVQGVAPFRPNGPAFPGRPPLSGFRPPPGH